MAYRVLDCRIYFNDNGNADNAYAHLVSLAQHSVQHDIHVGSVPQQSWVRLHDCFAEDNNGDTSNCITVSLEVLGGTVPSNGGEYPAWQVWDGNNENLYQVGDRVTHNGLNWESTVADNHWEPGVFGWKQI